MTRGLGQLSTARPWQTRSLSRLASRLASGSAGKPHVSAPQAKPRGKPKPAARPVKRYVPEDVSRFVKSGKLLTTRENCDFLVRYGIEPDTGRMERFTTGAGPELARLAAQFNATFAYSPRHVLHPHDLRYFEPRGHPLAAMKRSEYARKVNDEPLWIMLTSVGGTAAVVRTLTQRKLTRAIHIALQHRGYRSNPQGPQGQAESVRGTLWVTLHNSLRAATKSPEHFGTVLAEALIRECAGRRKREA